MTTKQSLRIARMQGSRRAEQVLVETTSYRRLRRSLLSGVLFSAVPFGLLLGGLSLMPIPGAVITSGYLSSSSAPKEIQSAQTAVVKAILAKDGDVVHAGQPLMQLDDTAARSQLSIDTKSRDQSAARIARLEAEALGQRSVTFPPELMARGSDPDVAAAMRAESELFRVRLEAYTSQLEQLSQQANQIDAQVKGVNGQIAAANQQFDLITSEVQNLQKLRAQDLVAQSQLSDMQRDLATVEGARAQYYSTIASSEAQQAGLRGQISELTAKRMSDAAEQQRETQGQYDEASEKQIADRMTVQQFLLTSPQDGVVTDLKVHTIGGVVSTTESLMTIVPGNDKLIAELEVSPRDVQKIHLGQEADLHFTSMGGSSAPEYSGEVTFVAPDLVYDQRTGVPHFVVRVAVKDPINEPGKQLRKLGPGMPVDVYLLGRAQSIISYIGQPIMEQAQRAFR
ncbi:MAG TPA: HlyD family type I secretion periplasmic adaptor subunit [Devosiaceae bacterium]|nr:HlyD family type I secretion periplasmic adaptor subunit [Devosiaceae bacterium]